MKNILVPTDFSDCALDALHVAADIARKSGSAIHIAHVYEKPLSGITLQIIVDKKSLRKLQDQIHEEIDRLAEQPFMDGLKIHKHYIPDRDLWQILSLESLKDVDLIVMGSHGSTGVHEFFVGSNTQKMVQMSEHPVLVIKEYVNPWDIKNIVFASNFYGEAVRNFDHIKNFTNLLGAKIHLLKVITPANFEKTKYSRKLMEDFAKDVGLSDYTVNTYNETGIERGIFEFCKQVDADLLAMETHGRKGIAHLIIGSTTEQVVNHAKLPVLSMKIEEPNYEYGVIFPELR